MAFRSAGPKHAKTKKRTVLGSVTSSATLGVVGLLVGLILIPLVFARVGAPQYGVWIVLSTLTTYLYQADLGMGSAVIRYASIAAENGNRRDLSTIFSSSLAWMSVVGIVLSPIVWVCSLLLLQSMGADAGLSKQDEIYLSSLSAGLILVLGVRAFSALLQGIGAWSLEKKYQFIGVIIRALGTVLVCVAMPNVVYLATVEALALVVPTVLSLIRVLRLSIVDISIGHVSVARIKVLLSYSVRVFAVGAVGTAIIQTGIIVAGLVASPAIAAYYNAILKVYLAVRQILTWIVEPFLPALSKVHSRDGSVERHAFGLILMSSLAGVVGSIGLALSAPSVIRLWLGAGVPLDELTLSLQLMLVGMAVNAFHIGAISVTNAMGLPGAFFRLQILWLFLTIGLTFYLGKEFGVIGIAYGNMAPILLLEILYIRKFLNMMGSNFRIWCQLCFYPILLVVLCGICFTGCVFVMALIFNIKVVAMIYGITFMISSLAVIVLARKSRPVMNVRETLRIGA